MLKFGINFNYCGSRLKIKELLSTPMPHLKSFYGTYMSVVEKKQNFEALLKR
jgi:hypothetical protein